jgi:hypothetical protein
MSRPSDEVLEIECINYGFLSVKARQAIEKILNHASLSAEEKLVLKRAQDFLISVSQGAELISTGCYHHSSNPVDSIKALKLAIDPLEALQKVVNGTPIADYFKTMADSVESCSNSSSAVTTESQSVLANTIQFFEGLHKSSISTLSNRSRSQYETGMAAFA